MQNTSDERAHCDGCQPCPKRGGYCAGCEAFGGGKLSTFDYLSDIPTVLDDAEEWVEVHFKNTRKGFYLNNLKINLKEGDLVAVEATPGHDIGIVSMTGDLVKLQMRKNGFFPSKTTPLKVFRVAKTNDLERFEEAKAREEETKIRSRVIAKELGLNMKIGDVEFQGDGLKAIFYYIADQRVDFRQLIKRLAEAFHIRIEMRQIGARQEAGRIGGIGPCGRQLCCSGWMTRFMSVGTNVARVQDLSMNPQKLAGQCAKLKCCLNYEVDVYQEAQRKLPPKDVTLKTSKGEYRLFKADPLAQMLTYVEIGRKRGQEEFTAVPADRVFEVIEMNNRGETPFDLLNNTEELSDAKDQKDSSKDILSEESLTRFDKPREKSARKKNNGNRGGSTPERNGNGKRKGRGGNRGGGRGPRPGHNPDAE